MQLRIKKNPTDTVNELDVINNKNSTQRRK